MIVEGRVFSGIGKGRYYVGHPEYQRRFADVLGYSPYPGTLNVKVEGGSVERLRRLRLAEGTRVAGFRIGDEGFSALRCHDGKLKEDRATLLDIEVTHYNETVMELISPTYLRGRYGLKDGDLVAYEAYVV